MERVPNEDTIKACLEYIKHSPDYTFEKFLKQHGAWKNVDDNGRNVKVSCPFHSDSSPSRYIDDNEKITNCFSCNRGGGYVKFVVMFNKIVLGNNSNFYSVLNNILSTDPKMQLKVGASTIFRIEERKIEDVRGFRRRKFVPQKEEIISSYLQLASTMQKEKMDSLEAIRLATLYVQDGYDPNSIYKILKDEGVSSSEVNKYSDLDISDILGDIDFNLDV